MRKLVIAAAVTLTVTTLVPAEAQVGVAEGRRCAFSSVTDPAIENGEVQTGQMNGGPLTAGAPGATIALTCTIQVGPANATHAGTDSVTASSAATLQTATLPPTLMSYYSPEGQPVYQCAQATINGETYYWNAGVDAGWSTSSAALCDEAIGQEVFPGPLTPVLELIDQVLIEAVDPITCPLLSSLVNPGVPGVDIDCEGDVEVGGVPIWDCPPYGS